MNRKDKCIVLDCKNKRTEGMKFCFSCYDYFVCGSGTDNGSQACKNDWLRIDLMLNQKLIDIEIEGINEKN